MDIKSKLIGFIVHIFSPELATIVVASLPVSELRGGLPLAIFYFKFSIVKAYMLSLLGNLLPVFPLLIIFRVFFQHLQEVPLIGRFFQWWFKRVEEKAALVNRWGFWGLVIFVAIPLPVTGAWTGTVASTLFNFPLHKGFLAIMIGVALAGGVVSLVSLGIFNIMG